jgi:hypothetical protein
MLRLHTKQILQTPLHSRARLAMLRQTISKTAVSGCGANRRLFRRQRRTEHPSARTVELRFGCHVNLLQRFR